jgi:hypothetical protein
VADTGVSPITLIPMSKYLVECRCGNQLPVDIGQAGGRVTCSCGNVVDVPPLRQLRHLPQDTTAVERPVSTWSPRKGLITASVLLVCIITIVNAISWFTQPTIPEFNADQYNQMVESRLKTLTPVEGWNQWVGHYRTLGEHGFGRLELVNRAAVESVVAGRQSLRRTLWVVAAIAAAVALAAAFWPKSRPIERHPMH